MGRLRRHDGGSADQPDRLLPDLTCVLDLPTILGQDDAYIGFTSGTGADYGNHDILAWEYRDEFDPVQSVPAHVTGLVFGLALLGLSRVR